MDQPAGAAIVCSEHHRSLSSVGLPHITGIHVVPIPHRLPDLPAHEHVSGWEHFLFELVGDPRGYGKLVTSPRHITPAVRDRIEASYGQIVAARKATSPSAFRIDPVSLHKASVDGDVETLHFFLGQAYDEDERLKILTAMATAALRDFVRAVLEKAASRRLPSAAPPDA